MRIIVVDKIERHAADSIHSKGIHQGGEAQVLEDGRDLLHWHIGQRYGRWSLSDVSVQEVSAILENLSFSILVDPFQMNGISGMSFNFIDYYTDIIKAGNINVVAQTFYEKYVKNWKANNVISKDLLRISSSAVRVLFSYYSFFYLNSIYHHVIVPRAISEGCWCHVGERG